VDNVALKTEGAGKSIPAISTEEMIEVDTFMVEELGIGLIQMMENAGYQLAGLSRESFLEGHALNKRVTILAGSGANGGGVLVAARHLHNRGAVLRVYTTGASDGTREATAQALKTLRHMGVEISQGVVPPLDEATELILDGIIGYNLKGAPGGHAAGLIRWANAHKAPVLSMDVPSGLDASTGEVFNPAIKASATMTLALPKKGLLSTEGAALSGMLYLADIGVPPEVYRRGAMGLEVGHMFSQKSIIRLR